MMVIPDFKRLCLALCLFSISIPAISQVYKWVDENGHTQFSQFPPPNQPSETIDVKPAPAISPVETGEEVDELIKQQQEADQAQQKEQQEAEKQAKQQAIIDENCRIARKNLKAYQDNPGRRVSDAEGNVTRLDEKDRQEKMKEFQQQIDRYCK